MSVCKSEMSLSNKRGIVVANSICSPSADCRHYRNQDLNEFSPSASIMKKTAASRVLLLWMVPYSMNGQIFWRSGLYVPKRGPQEMLPIAPRTVKIARLECLYKFRKNGNSPLRAQCWDSACRRIDWCRGGGPPNKCQAPMRVWLKRASCRHRN